MEEHPRILRRLYGLMLPYWRSIVAGMACLIIAVAAELYPPLIWQRVVDQGLAQQDWTFIGWQLGLLVLVFGVAQLFNAVRGIVLERAGQRLVFDLRQHLYERLQGQSAAYFAQQRTGDLLARITADVETLQAVLVRGTDSVLANALRVLGVASIFIALQPKLGLLVLLPMLVVGLLLRGFNRRVRPVYRAARARLGQLSARLADQISGVRVIQAFAQEQRIADETRAQGLALYNEQVAAVALRNRVFPLVRWVANFGNVLMLGGSVWFILRGEFTLGGLLAYRGYGRYFYGPIDDLVGISDLLQQAAAAGQRIFAVLDAPQSIADAPDALPLPRPLQGALRFEDVDFGYAADQPILRNITLEIPAGQRVAVLGPSGIGKSTLLALVARVYDPLAGRVLLDGHDLRSVTLESLRSQLAQVQQETYVFNASALENIRFARPAASMADVEAATRAANAHEFLAALPQGYATVLGERGVKLSGGQRQRLAVARALLANTPVLLLDEPTSAVEPESEAAIIAALEHLMQGRTTLIVSHRLSVARRSDRVLIINDGQIVEDGQPQELLQRPDSLFAQMIAAEQQIGVAALTDTAA